MFGSPSRLLSRTARVSIAVGLAVLGVVLVWASMGGPSPAQPALGSVPEVQSLPSTSSSAAEPSAERPTRRTDRVDVRDQITGLVLPESDAVAISIPRIGVRSTLVELGLDGHGEMEVPRDPALAGWFSGGAAPGALGPAIIAGHVTWDGTPAVFHRLGSMRRSDQVSVTRKDGRTAVFTVNRVARFSKAQFPSQEVYGAIDHAGLRLITCGGTYDAAQHRYLDNVVVFARLEAVHRAGRVGPSHR
jgi:sortase (surface protein transpeptidase)